MNNPYLFAVPEERPWRERAACAREPELFFDPQRVAQAVSFCASCPVRLPCADAARAYGEKNGVWGGVVRGRGRGRGTNRLPRIERPRTARVDGT